MGSTVEADIRLHVLCAVMSAGLLAGVGLVGAPSLLVAVALACCVLLAAVSPLGALCAVVATLPWFYRPLVVGEQRVAVSELLLVAGVLGMGIHLLVLWARQRATIAEMAAGVLWALSRPVVLALGTLTALGFLLSVAPYDPAHRADSLREWRWVLAEPLIMLVMLIVTTRERTSRALPAIALIVGAALASLQGMTDLVSSGGVAVEGVTRISGPFPHPNALALMTTRVAVLTIAWLVFDETRRRRLAVPATLATLAALATFSRGAWASLTAGVLLSATQLPSRLRLAVWTAPLVVLAAAFVVASDRMLSVFGGGSGSLRLSIWSSALSMIRDRPIRGYGPDQFLYAYLPRYVQPEAWQERFSAHSHNLILDFWIRLGIIGCAFAICVVIVCIVATAHHVRRPSQDNALAAAAVVALASAVVHGLVDDAYFSHELAMSGWLLAWLAFQPGRSSAAEGALGGASPRLRWRRVYRFASLRQSARGRS